MRALRALRAAAVAVLAASVAGCWDQPGFDPGRSGWNAGETELSAERVSGLVEVWDVQLPDARSVRDPISVGDSVYASTLAAPPEGSEAPAAAETAAAETAAAAPVGPAAADTTEAAAIPPVPPDAGGHVMAVDIATGELRWRTDLVAEGVVERTGWPLDPAYADGKVVVPRVEYFLDPYPNGGYVRLDPGTGAIVDREHLTVDETVSNLAVVDGALTFVRARYEVTGTAPATHRLSVPWTYEALAFTGPDTGSPPALRAGPTFAIAGDRVLWSFDGSALGFSPACPPPASGGTGCGPDWTTDLTPGSGQPPRSIAANGADEAVYTTQRYSAADQTYEGTVHVLDAATGAVRWTAPVWTRQQPAVTDEAILLAGEDGRLVALPAGGCGAPTCTPLWEAALGGRPTAPPVAGGDVVYATVGSRVLAFPAGGCGAATCEPLATVDAGSDITGGPILHDGHQVVGTADGRLVAYGLPG